MLNIHDLIRLTKAANAEACRRTIVFDGKVAISMNNGYGSHGWWAGVPFTQAKVDEPVAVPVDAIVQHLLKSRHLHVAKDHVHNSQGIRTAWTNKPHDWSNALSFMPPRPEGLPVQFDLELDALDRVLIAVDPGDIRASLQGVFFDFETGRLAGTDGARVHLYENKVPKLTRGKDQGALQIIVPKAPAYWLLKSDDKTARVSVWRLGAEKSLVLMQTTEALVYTVAIDAKFPDVMRVIPPRSTAAGTIRLNPIAFSDAVDDMRKLAAKQRDKNSCVTVQWGAGRVYANTGPDFRPVDFELVNYGAYPATMRKTLYAAFNPRFLSDVADCVTPQAEWLVPVQKEFERHGKTELMKTSDQPLAVFDGDFSAVVMPRRLEACPTDRAEPSAKPPKASKPAKTPAGRPAEPAQAATVPPKPGKPATEPENKPKPAPKAPAKPAPGEKPAQGPKKAAKPAPRPADLPAVASPAPEPAKPVNPAVVPGSGTVH